MFPEDCLGRLVYSVRSHFGLERFLFALFLLAALLNVGLLSACREVSPRDDASPSRLVVEAVPGQETTPDRDPASTDMPASPPADTSQPTRRPGPLQRRFQP